MKMVFKSASHVSDYLQVLHNDVHSNRLNPATYTILKMIGEKFAKSEVSPWKHVIVGYSKCNAHETSWRSGLPNKKKALQAEMRRRFADVQRRALASRGDIAWGRGPRG
mgnify:CR=1 FL=1